MEAGQAALVFALTVQGGALVWGASKISSSVADLARSVTKLVHDHETRVTVLERVQDLVSRREP